MLQDQDPVAGRRWLFEEVAEYGVTQTVMWIGTGIISAYTILLASRLCFWLYDFLFNVYLYKPELPHLKTWNHHKLGRIRRKGETQEYPPAVPNGWYYVMASIDLLQQEVKHVSMLGLDLAVFRDSKGDVHALDAFCPHLGANMGIGGKVKDDCLECPFHAWRFSGEDGKCVHIPGAKRIPDIAKTTSYLLLERNLTILLWFDAEGREPMWIPRELDEVYQEGWQVLARAEHTVHAHISEIPENGADIAHFNPVHRASFMMGSSLEDINKQGTSVSVGEHAWTEPTWAASKEDWYVAKGSLRHDFQVSGRTVPFTSVHTEFEQVGPAIVYLLPRVAALGKVLLLMYCIPVEPFKQKVIHLSLGPPHILGKVRAALGVVIEGTMVERDAVLWNHKLYRPKGVLASTNADELIVKFRRWYSQFYSEHSSDVNMNQANLDW